MNREYDLFERFSDGTQRWRVAVIGRERAMEKLKELSGKSTNWFYAMHLPTKEILAAIPPRPPTAQLQSALGSL